MWVFGGFNGILDLHFNDLHCFDPIRNIWQNIETHGTKPKIRRRQSCVVIGSKMYLFGGTWWVQNKQPWPWYFILFSICLYLWNTYQSFWLSIINQNRWCLLNKIIWISMWWNSNCKKWKLNEIIWSLLNLSLCLNDLFYLWRSLSIREFFLNRFNALHNLRKSIRSELLMNFYRQILGIFCRKKITVCLEIIRLCWGLECLEYI